ncbi:MAG: type IX secretion system sortase PorU [Prevotella sp.]|nr:type IX secretion system sortase PorU [Prevotella sp.]
MRIAIRTCLLLAALCITMTVQAQRFFNLTSDEVRVDTVLPHFGYAVPLDGDYQDSVYTATILYPEFIDMTAMDLANYRRLSTDTLPSLPVVSQDIVTDRKRGALQVGFCPLVYRDGRYQILVSFMLRVDAKATDHPVRRTAALTRATTASSRYADHSVLASGTWAKIRVPASGIYQLTDALIRKAGFTDLSKVKIYGYGGNLQNETLTAADLQNYDDLKEVATCTVGGKRLFYAKGPVNWSSKTATRRTRNPYSDYGYYFLTQSDATPSAIDSAAFLSSFYPSADDYHTLYEVDGYSWYHGGRNLFDTEQIAVGKTKNVVLTNSSASSSGLLSVNVSAGTAAVAQISLNDSVLGRLNISLGEYDKGNDAAAVYNIGTLHATDTVKIQAVSGGPLRLDYVSMAWSNAAPAPSLTGAFASPEYVYNITNQDHHADGQADMVIIIPTSQNLLTQAQRLADYHTTYDSLRVRIVPADELYNEFSSGTPDANAYRRYLKMLYDRAESEEDMPRYLLLMGDCVWDNRMLTSECSALDPDDYLLCFESENSFNEITCYVDDGFFGLLDDGEGSNPLSKDKLDLAVGRFPVTTEAEAKVMVDKTVNYGTNKNAGAWQNTIMFMGDDGNSNIHMRDINIAAEDIATRYPGFLVKKVLWDAYNEETSATGNSYPEVASLIKQQQAAGALIMDYGGHGRADQISHEAVLKLTDFEGFTNKNLPLWITASCDIMAFDGVEQTIGETAVLNANGGAVAFFGTTRTVYSNYNKLLNMAYLRYVLSRDDNGNPVTMGEAQRLAKNLMITAGQDLTTNKLQYSLLGDPALALSLPAQKIVVDSINGIAVSTASSATLRAGSVARVAGHIEGAADFSGIVTAVVRDSKQLITCKMNASAEAETAFTFYDRTNTLYNGSDSIRAGQFSFSFAVPMDINYADAAGLMNIYAINNAQTQSYNGYSDNFLVGGTDDTATDSVGPKIYCYLNTPEFQNGGRVNITPYFVAQIKDDDGINVTGNGIGHDLQLIIDGDATKTYTLNDNFQYDFGTYTSGSTYYSIPALEPGNHTLLFRAWDVRNNPSTATLDFTVVKALSPTIYSVDVSTNPASTSTTFIVNHDMSGSEMNVNIDVFDTSGRLLWTHSESGVSTNGAYTVDWDLTTDNGGRLQTGIYLYRIRVASDGSVEASKAKKLIVISNN